MVKSKHMGEEEKNLLNFIVQHIVILHKTHVKPVDTLNSTNES